MGSRSKAGRRFARRKRRQERTFLRTGDKPRHRLTAGRTGGVHSRKLKSRRASDKGRET